MRFDCIYLDLHLALAFFIRSILEVDNDRRTKAVEDFSLGDIIVGDASIIHVDLRMY